jgi:hypothetical protein
MFERALNHRIYLIRARRAKAIAVQVGNRYHTPQTDKVSSMVSREGALTPPVRE